MSETERNDAGQFTAAEPDTTGLYGREAELVQAGWKALPDTRKEQTSEITPDAAVESLADSASDDGYIEPIIYYDRATGDPTAPNEAITIEQAAADLAAWHETKADHAEFGVGTDFAAQVDALREQAANDPKLAEHYGLEKTDDAAKPTVQSEEPATASVDGLDPEVSKALAHPQIRQAIESELTETHRVREAYSSSLQQGQQFLQATIASLAPDLQGVPVERWGEAIQLMAQVDPVRAQLVGDALGKWSTIQQAAQQDQQQKAWAAKQQFDNYTKAEDARFREMMGNDRGKIETSALQIVDYAKEMGIDRDTFVQLLATQPIMRHAAFQKMMVDAAAYRELRNTDWRKGTTRVPAPPVQRPGTPGPRPSFDSELESNFKRNPSLKNASALYASKKAR